MCSETNNAQLYPSILRLVLCCIIKYSFSIPWFVLILHCWWDSMRTSLGFEQSWALNCCPSYPFARSTTSSRHPAAPIAAGLLLPLLSLSLLLLTPWCNNLLQLPRLRGSSAVQCILSSLSLMSFPLWNKLFIIIAMMENGYTF